MKPWETDNEQLLFDLLVGDWYGENPAKKLDLLRKDKAERADYLCGNLDLNRDSVVLEIGSGAGFTSKYVAKQVKELHCCDISDSFLKYAKKECEEIPNISFYKIDESLRFPVPHNFFDAVYSEAVFIHLNLFDIYWYFSEFSKVVKTGGKVLINVMDDATIDRKKIIEMAQYYYDDRSSLKMLLCWNSVAAVIDIASHFGFSLISRHYEVSVYLKFVKEK